MTRLLTYLKPYRAAVAAILALVFVQSLADLYLPTLLSDIVDTGVVQGDTGYIFRVGGLMLLVAAAGAVAAVTVSYLSARTAAAFARELRRRVFDRVSRFSLHEFNRFGTATLITRTTNDITQIQMVVLMMLRMMLFAPLMGIGGIVMAVAKDATLSLLLVVVLPAIAGVVLLLARRGIPLFEAMQAKLDRVNRVLREGLMGVRVIRAFNRTPHESQRFQAANLDLTETAIRVNQIMAALMPVTMLVMSLATVAILWFGGIRVDRGAMQVGDMMAFIQYGMMIMFSLMMLSMMFVMIPRASASAVRVAEVLAVDPAIKDPAVPRVPEGRRGLVEFRNVTFSYPGAERPALENISFTARPGEVTAIIGGTGSGKSTLVNLIPRFYDVASGAVLVDGVDVREMDQAELRSRIGFVPQEALLFTGTVAENIRYGREDADDQAVRRAAEIAQASGFIAELPEGYGAMMAQGGTNLSGGQKQRLSIARALVRQPEIYIFDDSFSALDYRTDARLRAALRPVTREATVLIVAQRVSTVMDADRMIVLDEGRVAAMGTHAELVRHSRVYREILASQLSEEALA